MKKKTKPQTRTVPHFDGSAWQSIAAVLPPELPRAARVVVLENALGSPMGPMIRDRMGQFVVQALSVLVPDIYEHWRTLVQDAMYFVVMHLSPGRLAPKILEQMELPADTPPEARLLHLIARVPGLQKIGQVLARNRHLDPPLRRALSQLENGISEVSAEDIHRIIVKELGSQLATYAVQVKPGIFSEASVSAVVRFTWRNPETRRRERGVFKVKKPHIPDCYAEDMRFLQDLAEFLGRKHGRYGVPARGIADTFSKVRQLLQHEVNFRGEQRTLLEAYREYGDLSGVRVPRLIPQLCTSDITAITEERGVKVTDAVARLDAAERERVAEQLIETLIAAPLFAPQEQAMFHADPHAGNLLYDRRNRELVLLDWALTESLTREQRRHLTLFFVMMALRDTPGVAHEIAALSQSGIRTARQTTVLRRCVERFFGKLPVAHLPGARDAMRLVEQAALTGIRFPAPLIMLSKVMSTLDGILYDIAAPNVRVETVLARHLARRWISSPRNLGAPLSLKDWVRVQVSASLYGGRIGLQWAQSALDRWQPVVS